MTPARLVALSLALVGVIAALAIVVSGCGGSDDEAGAAKNEGRPEAQAGADELPAQGQPDEETGSGEEQLIAANGRLLLRTPAHAYPVIWVRKGHTVEMRTGPGGGELVETVGKRSEFGSPSVFGVIRREGKWAGVTTPELPNGQLGWIELDPKKLAAGWTRLSIDVDLSDYEARFGTANRTLRKFSVTVGAPGSETPTGRFAITDTFKGDLNAAYGCCALATTGTQPNLPSGWLGGNRIAIHGTYGELGVAASHGCVRAANKDVATLVKRVPLGTPVFIHE